MYIKIYHEHIGWLLNLHLYDLMSKWSCIYHNKHKVHKDVKGVYTFLVGSCPTSRWWAGELFDCYNHVGQKQRRMLIIVLVPSIKMLF